MRCNRAFPRLSQAMLLQVEAGHADHGHLSLFQGQRGRCACGPSSSELRQCTRSMVSTTGSLTSASSVLGSTMALNSTPSSF